MDSGSPADWPNYSHWLDVQGWTPASPLLDESPLKRATLILMRQIGLVELWLARVLNVAYAARESARPRWIWSVLTGLQPELGSFLRLHPAPLARS